VFLLIGKTSALTMNIAGVIKDWMLIFFSFSLFHAPVTRLNLAGYAFCCSGEAELNPCCWVLPEGFGSCWDMRLVDAWAAVVCQRAPLAFRGQLPPPAAAAATCPVHTPAHRLHVSCTAHRKTSQMTL